MKNPVGQKQREQIVAVERNLQDLVGYLQKCKNCDIPVSDLEEAAAFLYDRLQRLKTEFIGVKPERTIDTGVSANR